jgi:excisionase family DNA binding protein
MALRKSSSLSARGAGRPNGSVYSAQAVADFCEVDLKTVHHWADRGKVPHFRTDGRHLRFRRNDVVRFLRAHGYPLPDALVRARPTIALALGASLLEGASLSLEELTKRLGSRFSVRRHASGVGAVAHLVSEAPDAVILAHDDATLGFPSVLGALKAEAATSWIVLAVVTAGEAVDGARPAGADIVLASRDVVKLPGELARTLAVS